jgi:hypothetical protein
MINAIVRMDLQWKGRMEIKSGISMINGIARMDLQWNSVMEIKSGILMIQNTQN